MSRQVTGELGGAVEVVVLTKTYYKEERNYLQCKELFSHRQARVILSLTACNQPYRPPTSLRRNNRGKWSHILKRCINCPVLKLMFQRITRDVFISSVMRSRQS